MPLGPGARLGPYEVVAAIRVPVVFLYEPRGDKIVRERRIYDFTGMLVQIGVLKARPA